MKKIRFFLVLTCALLLIFPAKAERVNIEKAEKIARAYARTTPRLTARKAFRHSRTVSKPLQRNRPGLQRAAQSAVPQEEPLYHIFTMNGAGGFIVVAGDDVAKPVLGYSDEGTYDETNPNLAYWMETLAQEIAAAIENGVEQDAPTKVAWDALYSGNNIAPMASGGYVDPLVKTRWNQGAPYNNLCPLAGNIRTVTGCVATAMAQIMKYHDHPTTRTATIPGYTTDARKFAIPSITGTTTYGWDNMTNTYTSYVTGASADAVAELMYHCGVSVKMDYNTVAENGSGAYSSEVVTALKNYFNYDAGIAYCHRNYYTYTEWINLLKTELKANRPVYYAGYGKSGHAFVCDGYDADDLFHFNWGWGGSSDGYFEVSALNPGSLGIGGGSGGFNENQEIITGIQPNQGSSVQPAIQLGLSTFSANKTSLNSLTTSFNVSAGYLTNTGIVTIAKVYLGVLLCNEDDSYRSHKTSERNIGLGPDYYYPDYTLLSNYSLPADLPAGTYKLYPAYSASSGTPSIIPGINGNRYITVVVAQDGKVTLTAAAVKPDLSLVSLKAVGNLYRNRTGNFEAEITNSGMADYNARMSLRLGTQTVATDPVVIPAGATKTVGFSGNITLAVGTYSLSVRYDPDNVPGIEPSTQLGDVVSPIEVKATPTENPVLSLEGTPSFKNGSGTVPQNEPDLTVKIKNTGGVYQGNVYVDIYPKNSVDVQLGSFGSVYVSINKNETKSISYNNSLYSLTPGQQYDAYVYAEEYDYLYPKFTFTLAAPVYSSDATLKSLVVKDAQTQTPLALTPTFSSTITSYTAMAPHETTMISIIGEANHKRAQFTNIENQSLGGGNTFNMTVTAEDGATEKTYTVTVVRAEQPALTNLAVDGLTPPFDPDITEYAVTLPCGTDNFTATATPNAGSTVSYLVNNNPVTLPLPLHTPGMTSLVIRVTAQDGVTVHDYTIAITRPFDASIIRTYWNDVLAVNLNPNTNGGYVFTGFQWTKNGQPVANETGPYLYFPTPPPATDRYNVWLTTDNGQTLSTCSAIQITSAAVPPAGLLAYPNPARYAVTLENPQWETVAQTDLINLSGNLVRRYPSARIQTLDVSGLPVGLYILRAGAHTVKIVIE